jgi:hypothetical protein
MVIFKLLLNLVQQYSWNEVWFKYDTGITNRFIFSPTYTAIYTFGMSMAFEDDTLDLMILAKRKPIVVCVKKIGLKKKELYIEDSSF